MGFPNLSEEQLDLVTKRSSRAFMLEHAGQFDGKLATGTWFFRAAHVPGCSLLNIEFMACVCVGSDHWIMKRQSQVARSPEHMAAAAKVRPKAAQTRGTVIDMLLRSLAPLQEVFCSG